MKAFFAASPALGFFKPETDEQVAGYTDEFPEDEHLEKIIRQHDAEHREREQTQEREEARLAPVMIHVAVGINMDRATDPGDDEEHHQAQRVKFQAEIHVQPHRWQASWWKFPWQRNENHWH